MDHELDTANNSFCIYEKIKFAFFWPTLYYSSIDIVLTYYQDRLLLRNIEISFSIRLVPGVDVLGFSGTQDLWQKQCWSVELKGRRVDGRSVGLSE